MQMRRTTSFLMVAASLVFLSSLAAAQIFNAASDFSATSNPNGAWSYGWSYSRGSGFFLLPTPENLTSTAVSGTPGDSSGPSVSPGVDIWTGSGICCDVAPAVAHNPTPYVLSPACCNPIPPGGLALHPGPDGENTIVRWTAPAKALYKVTATFVGRDWSGPTSTDVAVLYNATQPNGVQLYSSNVLGYGSSSTQSYSGQVPVLAGDTIDFTVGFGPDGNYGADLTGLDATVTPMIQVLVSDLTNLINSSNLNSRLKTFLLAYVQQIPTLVNSLTATQKQQAIQNLKNLMAAVKWAMSANLIPASLGNQLINVANEAIAVLSFS